MTQEENPKKNYFNKSFSNLTYSSNWSKFYLILVIFAFHYSPLFAQLRMQDSITWLIDSTKNESYEVQYSSGQRALFLAKKADLVEAQAKALLQIATSQSLLGKHVTSLKNFTKAKNLIEQHDLQTLKKAFYLKKAGVLVRIKHYEAAIAHNEEAVDWFASVQDSVNWGLTLGNIGAVHYKKNDLETALSYYERALAINPEKDDNLILTNLAGLYITQEQPRKAIPMLERSLEHAKKRKNNSHQASILTNLGVAHGLTGNYQKAFEYYNSALELAEKENLIDSRYDALRLMSYTYETKGDYRKALETYRSYKTIQEELIGKKTQKEIAELNLKYEAIENEKELAINKEKVVHLEQEAKIKSQRSLLFLALVSALGALGVLLFFKRRTDFEKNKKLHKAEQELMQSQLKNKELAEKRLQEKLEYKNKDLTNLTLDITRKNEFSNQLLSQISELEKYVPKGAQSQLNSIKFFITDNLRINKELAVFQENIKEVNQDFYSRLLTRFPNLTSKETELCGLIKLSQTNKEIAALKNISLNSAKMNRYRLRKKLNLATEVDIVNFLREI